MEVTGSGLDPRGNITLSPLPLSRISRGDHESEGIDFHERNRLDSA
jgi:hypothetical protein